MLCILYLYCNTGLGIPLICGWLPQAFGLPAGLLFSENRFFYEPDSLLVGTAGEFVDGHTG